ncbi:hypothetical protein CBR_g22866 [Chara braunii]|uniref:Retrotransposon gag domain-containing protein n=1 Tax=Chara braunii TaxID=69332 RepID=A0A388L2V9_CHABU|nr:hypothetical protein CBR_g22866 [Chara braunii]|eukprot:GBG76650.1 hypothetical protein CBR_g22866 [Chara braunii]
MVLTHSKISGMDQQPRETTEAYAARMLDMVAEFKQRAAAATSARKKEDKEAEEQCHLAEQQQQADAEAERKAVDERSRLRRDKLLECEGDIKQEDILCVDTLVRKQIRIIDELLDRVRRLEQQLATTTPAGPSNLTDRVKVLEIDVETLKDDTLATNQRIDQQICATAASPTATTRESIPKFDGLPIFCNATKTYQIPWWRQFELKLDIQHVINPNRHTYLYSRSGAACQAWLDNMLSTHNVTVSELHTKISWADLKAAWHKRFQVEPPELQAAKKLQRFYQNDLPSTDWITEYQHLASTPNLPSTFVAIKHFFIRRSCPALQNALTQVAETLATSEQLFDKASQIIVKNIEAKNLGYSSVAGQGRGQHQPKVAVVAATTATDTSNEAASFEEGDRLAAARDGGRPARGRGRGKPKTHTNSALGAGPAAQEPWTHYGISEGVYRIRAKYRYFLWCNSAVHDTATCPTLVKGEFPSGNCGGNILAYVTKVAREFRIQRYDANNAPLLYVRIQVGQASCNALLDSGATRNFISQSFIQRAGLGAQVRRKPNPTAIKLADGRTQQLLDRYIEVVPVYFAPHACEPVMFDVLDTDFDIILGMPWFASADHTVNVHQRTLAVRDAFSTEMQCTIPLPHSSIRCQVVMAKSFQATCAYERTDEIGLCFLRATATTESSPTDLSSDPRVVRLLDEFTDIFESPTDVVPDRLISHEIILEAGVVPPKGCIYRMSQEELEALHAQLDDLLDKG